MSKRRIASFCAFAFALAAALVMVTNPNRHAIVSPGRLASQHSTAAHQCDQCHFVGDDGLVDWLGIAFDKDSEQHQSQLCLKCHDDLGEEPLSPHSISPSQLAEFTDRGEPSRRSSSWLLATARSVGGSPMNRSLVCATCHKEHQGSDFNLKQMADQQCQVCHQQSFTSFHQGHPDFLLDDHMAPRHILFDHQSHFRVHFDRGNHGDSPIDCGTCHQSSVAGHQMLLKGYQATCAKCHEDQIQDDTGAGFEFFSVPIVDVATISQTEQTPTAAWPAAYPLHPEARRKMTPMVALLLQGEPQFAEAMGRLRGLDLGDLSEASTEQIAAVKVFTSLFRELLVEIASKGKPEIERRLKAVLHAEMSDTEIHEFTELMPVELFDLMLGAWFPNPGNSGVPGKSDPASPLTEAGTIGNKVAIQLQRKRESASIQGWYLRESDLSIRYRASGHHDLILRQLYDLAVRHAPHTEDSSTAWHTFTRSFVDNDSQGRCLKCHNVDRPFSGDISIRWNALSAGASERAFTQFNHAPHLKLTNNTCSSCHDFPARPTASHQIYESELVAREAPMQPLASDFHSHRRTECAECHRPNSGTDRCTTCHNYHVHPTATKRN